MSLLGCGDSMSSQLTVSVGDDQSFLPIFDKAVSVHFCKRLNKWVAECDHFSASSDTRLMAVAKWFSESVAPT